MNTFKTIARATLIAAAAAAERLGAFGALTLATRSLAA
jgi:hypothetical protein